MTYNVGTAEWHEERRSYLGASEMAAALGLSPWGDPISVWEEKIGEAQPRVESFRMKLGTMIEPIIGRLVAEQTGERVIRMSGPRRHPMAPFLASNPDFRFARSNVTGRTGRGLVQAKLRLDEPFGEADDGAGAGIPLHYRLQGLGELMTTGFDFVYFAALDPRQGVSLYPLDRRMADNEDAIGDLYHDCVEFWTEYVVPKKLPPPSAKSAEALRRRYPEAKLLVGKIASATQSETLDELLRLRDSEKAIKEELDAVKNTVKGWIADAQWIEGAGKRFTWSRFDVTKIAWEEIAKAYRELIEQTRANRTVRGARAFLKMVDLDAVESLYTRTEREDRLNVGEIK